MSSPLSRDLARYPRSAILTHPQVWATAYHRFQQAARGRCPAAARKLVDPALSVLTVLVRLVTRIEIGSDAEIGGGLMIHHGGNIVIHPGSRLGEDCVLLHGVTIGNRGSNDSLPVLGDRVEVGAYAQVLGGITIGDDAKIGALALVVSDVPAGGVAFGPRAEVRPPRPSAA